MDTPNDILARDWNADFIKKMQNRILVSHYKYGWMKNTYPELAQAVKVKCYTNVVTVVANKI